MNHIESWVDDKDWEDDLDLDSSVLDFFRYWVDCRPDWFTDKVSTNEIITHETHCEISTPQGVLRGEVGDYIILGESGKIYPCKPETFEVER